jgi:hypothetical protein
MSIKISNFELNWIHSDQCDESMKELSENYFQQCEVWDTREGEYKEHYYSLARDAM